MACAKVVKTTRIVGVVALARLGITATVDGKEL